VRMVLDTLFSRKYFCVHSCNNSALIAKIFTVSATVGLGFDYSVFSGGLVARHFTARVHGEDYYKYN
jgi:hypothetical protein